MILHFGFNLHMIAYYYKEVFKTCLTLFSRLIQSPTFLFTWLYLFILSKCAYLEAICIPGSIQWGTYLAPAHIKLTIPKAS